MPQPPTLKIVEIFASVQGEGLRQGEPTIFIRLAGCDLRCSFCDTKYAWTGGKIATTSQVLVKVRALRKRFPADWACLTGGEPFLQDIGPLVDGLKKEGLKVQVETNGRNFRHLAADWLSISPKPGRYEYHPGFRRQAKEVKLVVSKTLTFETVRRLREEFPGSVPILLQAESRDEPSARHSPVACIHGRVRRKWTPGQCPGPRPPSNEAWSLAKGRRLLSRALRQGLINIRLSVQLHKIFGLR